jgi:acyl carrier protein
MTGSSPSKTEVYERLRHVLIDEFGVSTDLIRPTAHLVKDLDLDSIDWINMAVALEAQTGRKLREEDLASIRTVQDVVDAVHRQLLLA